jgi:hypothetical protein
MIRFSGKKVLQEKFEAHPVFKWSSFFFIFELYSTNY